MKWATFKVRFRQAWRHLWYGDLLMDDATKVRWTRIQRLLSSDLSQAVEKAVRKGAKDSGLKSGPDDRKRAEAQQWTGTYLTDRAGMPDKRWETNFLIEWWVGVLTGKL